MRKMIIVLLLNILILAGSSEGRSPNVIILYTDDMGYGDVGCFGATDIKTPNIDALARSGIRLTDFYSAAPICAPARAALLTGRYPTRAGMSTKRNVPSCMGVPGMSTDEITIAELAKDHGYATALFGKWHLGSTPDTQPNGQGFDLFFGHHASCIDSFSHMYYASEPYYHDLYRNRQEIWEDGQHMTDLISRESIRFIQENRERPFLIYVSYNTPHYPMVSPGRFVKMYDHLPVLRRYHAALIAGIDESVGKIVNQLYRMNLTDNTLVFFASDNGAANRSNRGEGGGSNAPLREYKRSLFDGGIRVPGIVSWPGTVPANETRDQLAIAMDVFTTVADVIGADLPKGKVMDGISWMPFLKNPDNPGHKTLFFEWNEQHAVRKGKWKVVRNGLIDIETKGRQNRAVGGDYIFLSDMSADPGERTNLYKQNSNVADQLLKMHDRWRASIAADKTASKSLQY
ncbi:MAG: sulfatase-like hydrolase/transferase [Planctomycetota bacterium]|nr:MAG: sulfatase-like hydrolase/transferase [Planctomycetota bacterium]